MKKMSVLLALVLAFALSAMAQTPSPNDQSSSTPSTSQDTTSPSSSPSSTSPSSAPSSTSSSSSQSSTSPSSSQSSTSPSAAQGSTAGQQDSSTMGQAPAAGTEAKSADHGHKVKGCIRSEGGKYLLEDAHGRMYSLNTTEDLSAHVGHEVVIHGTVSGNGSSMNKSDMSKSDTSNSSMSSSAAGGNKEIAVTKVDMVSETCKLGGKHSKTSSNDQTKGTSPDKQQ